jgi:hypothetical protein
MDLDQAEALIKERQFGGLLYAHTYGEASTPNLFFDSVKKLSPMLIIIDDRCLCVPDLETEPANKADVQLYSTGYAKIVELNSGGYAFARDDINYQPAHLPFNPADHEQMEKSYKLPLANREICLPDSDWLIPNRLSCPRALINNKSTNLSNLERRAQSNLCKQLPEKFNCLLVSNLAF